MELCSGGDLLNYVRKTKKLDEPRAKYAFKSLIKGLQHCHSRFILHRDIKLDNVLLNLKGELKICDFGVAKRVKSNEIMTEHCGTPAYIAPEILKGKGYKGFGVDIWSAGVALYAMLYGTVPFKGNELIDLHKAIKKAKYNLKEGISNEAKSLIKAMLNPRYQERLSIEEILNHKWLQDCDDNIEIFNSEEKAKIIKEYSYSSEAESESQAFTEQNIDSSVDELTKNITEKSVILAPFNSVASNNNESEDELYERKDILKLGPKTRDPDRQYEKNNNCEVDNGVYNKFVCESSQNANLDKKISQSLITSSEESLESLQNNNKNNQDSSKSNDLEIEVDPEFPISIGKLYLDKFKLKEMEKFGYSTNYVESCLIKRLQNHATTTYYIICNK